MSVHPAIRDASPRESAPIFLGGRSASLSSQIVADVRDALFAKAQASIGDAPAYTRSCRDFHLAVAEASHNRVLVTQLVSLQHVSWPSENRTLTREVARRVLAVHRELTALIEMRDAAGARKLMDDH